MEGVIKVLMISSFKYLDALYCCSLVPILTVLDDHPLIGLEPTWLVCMRSLSLRMRALRDQGGSVLRLRGLGAMVNVLVRRVRRLDRLAIALTIGPDHGLGVINHRRRARDSASLVARGWRRGRCLRSLRQSRRSWLDLGRLALALARALDWTLAGALEDDAATGSSLGVEAAGTAGTTGAGGTGFFGSITKKYAEVGSATKNYARRFRSKKSPHE